MMTCIDLRERFGDRYRICCEESYEAEHGKRGRADDLWLRTIPCQYGHLFPFGGNLLAASVDGHPNVAAKLRRLRCCRVHQDGDFGELTVVFDVEDFGQVAKVMKPRRRRRLSAEQRRAAAERLKQFHFSPARQSQKSTPECVSTG